MEKENKLIKSIGRVTTDLKRMNDGKGVFIGAVITNWEGELEEYQLTIYKNDVILSRLAETISVGQLIYLEGRTKVYNNTDQIRPYTMFLIPNSLDINLFTKKILMLTIAAYFILLFIHWTST